MKTLRIRGLVGSIISLCMGVAGIAFLFLPMLVDANGHTVYSVFDSITKIGDIGAILGADGTLYLVSAALMIVFTILSLAFIALAITSLIGVCDRKYSLSMAIAMRCLSLIAAVVATISTTTLLLYFTLNNISGTTFGVGPIISIVVALIGVAASFVLPSMTAYAAIAKNEKELPTTEQPR